MPIGNSEIINQPMQHEHKPDEISPFDAETWQQLSASLTEIPQPVRLHLWADPNASLGEREAARLAQALAAQFEKIDFAIFPRRINYPYYPVLGVMGLQNDEVIDYGVRIIGLPAGFQLTALIAGIQAVSFQGVTLEPKTRIQIKGLKNEVRLEILTAADNEMGTLMAKTAFGLAVVSEKVRAFLIMADVFPEAVVKYSANELPHTVINGRYHLAGLVDEEELLKQIAKAIK